MNARHLLPRLVLFAGLAAVIIWAALNRDRVDLDALDAWLSRLGVLAPLAYLGLYAVGTVGAITRSFLDETFGNPSGGH